VSIRSDEWFPMNGKPDAPLPGFMIEIARKAFGEVDYKLMPWRRAVKEVRDGRSDCVIGTDKLETPDFVFPAENWGLMEFGVYVRSIDDWGYIGPDSLSHRKVGVVTGYSYDDLDGFMSANRDVFKPVAGIDGTIRNIKKLVTGRLDTVIENTFVARSTIAQLGVITKVKKVGSTGPASPVYIACSPAKAKSIELVEQVDVATKRLRASGELAVILKKYGLSDWQ
jgi:polar amino acid transport system substrate-binding protein